MIRRPSPRAGQRAAPPPGGLTPAAHHRGRHSLNGHDHIPRMLPEIALCRRQRAFR
jgi:hypothetical protein